MNPEPPLNCLTMSMLRPHSYSVTPRLIARAWGVAALAAACLTAPLVAAQQHLTPAEAAAAQAREATQKADESKRQADRERVRRLEAERRAEEAQRRQAEALKRKEQELKVLEDKARNRDEENRLLQAELERLKNDDLSAEILAAIVVAQLRLAYRPEMITVSGGSFRMGSPVQSTELKQL